MGKRLICAMLLTLGCSVEPPAGSNWTQPLHITGFGDSITFEAPTRFWQYTNASWLHRMNLPGSIGLSAHAKPGISCEEVLDTKWAPNRDSLERGDVAVVMCCAGNFNTMPKQPSVDAVVTMAREAAERGVTFIYATQPARHVTMKQFQPDGREFYEAVRARLPRAHFIDNDREWNDRGHSLDDSLYSDGVHMSEAGGRVLADAMRKALCRGVVDCGG